METNISPLWKSLIALIVLLPIVAGLAYWAGLRTGRDEVVRPVSVVGRTQGANLRRQGSLEEARRAAVVARPTVATATATNTAVDEAPSTRALCEASWSEIAGADLPAFETELLRGRVYLSDACLQAMQRDPAMASVRGFVERCQGSLAVLQEPEIQRSCVPRAADFRSFVVWNLGRGETNLAEADVPELANQLYGGFVDLKNASRDDVERSLQVADALIERNPDMYAAYKAKLVSLMLKELKFGEEVDPEVYNDTYSQLLSFEQRGANDPVAEERADSLSAEAGESAELSAVDRDLVHLPFLRHEAKGDYAAVADLAQEYVQTYPNSYVGYYYLADATWRQGDEEQAVSLFRRGLRNSVSETAAREMLTRLRNQDPLERLYRMQLQ